MTPSANPFLLTVAMLACALAVPSRAAPTAEDVAAATEAVDAEPASPSRYAERARLYDQRREFDKAIADHTKVIELAPRNAAAYQRRGEDHFRLGHFKEAVADFDKEIGLAPGREPYHWQRGIALYYAGEFERGRKQFELHKTVNPDDVENAAWHYLCVARLSGVEAAKKSLIPVTGDGRVPMAQVQAMLSGEATPDQVFEAARAGKPDDATLRGRLFYAHLYVGLYHEAAGRAGAAREHVLLAADQYAGDDYMGDVARVHAGLMKRTAVPKPATVPNR